MFDFELTEAGDLAYEEMELDGSFHLAFVLSKHKAQRISFLSIPRSTSTRKTGGQHISFKYSDEFAKYHIKPRILDDEKELQQALLFKFRTELGELNDPDVGSEFYKHIHDIIAGDKDLKKIREAAEEVASEYYPDAIVKVSYEIAKRAGNFAFQSVIVRLADEDDKLISEFMF